MIFDLFDGHRFMSKSRDCSAVAILNRIFESLHMYQKQFVSYEIISRCDGVSGGFYRPVCGWCRGGSECSDRCWITDSGPVNGGVFFWTDRPWERLHGNDGKCPRTAWKRGSLADCHLFLSLVFLPLFFIPLHQPVCPSCPPLSIFTSASLISQFSLSLSSLPHLWSSLSSVDLSFSF